MQIVGYCTLCTEYVQDFFVWGYDQAVQRTKTGMQNMIDCR
jgi:hypothetical protein